MGLVTSAGVPYLRCAELAAIPGLRHGFSTRFGGVSTGHCATMNFGKKHSDNLENITENYQRFCAALGVSPEKVVAAQQTHGTKIGLVTRENFGSGVWREHDFPATDGLLTASTGAVLSTYHADCAPVYFFEPKKRVVGLAHAGWRGTVDGICGKMAAKMEENFGCAREDILCAIGPAIGACCFEVQCDVAEKISKLALENEKTFLQKIFPGKYKVSLENLNKEILLNAGILPKNIHLAEICTSCAKDLFFSHRATKGLRGTAAAMISMDF